MKNMEVFSWTHTDMVGIHPDIMCHKLNIDSKVNSVRKSDEN